MNSDFWKQKKVLVTGADGFIGSHLVEMLVEKEANVRGFVFYNSFGSAGWLDNIEEKKRNKIEIFSGDIRDANRVEEAVSGQDIVFHLSSLIAIPYSYHAPESYVQTNVNGAVNILNACRRGDVEKIIHTSTSEVYGTAQYVPIDEKHPLQGQSPYSASKIGADMIAESFYKSFELPVAIARPFNTYGPRQSARAVIPTILSQLHAGVKKLKLGAVSPTRDFNYVKDTVAGFCAIAESDKSIGKIINIGTGKEITIKDLVNVLIEISGKDAEIVCDETRLRPQKSEVNRLLCSANLLKTLTNWKPEYSLKEGLSITSEWVKNNLEIFKVKEYTF